MSDYCPFCGGSTKEIPPGQVLALGGDHVCCRAVFEKAIQREALESAAKMLEEAAKPDVGHEWQKNFREAASCVRLHRPWEKPAPAKPKVSKRAMTQAIDRYWNTRAVFSPSLNELRKALYEALSEVLDLED